MGLVQDLQMNGNAVSEYGVFSVTGALVGKFNGTYSEVKDAFNKMQVPQGAYYLKDLKSNRIHKVVK